MIKSEFIEKEFNAFKQNSEIATQKFNAKMKAKNEKLAVIRQEYEHELEEIERMIQDVHCKNRQFKAQINKVEKLRNRMFNLA